MAMARKPAPEEELIAMLERYFCDQWMIHNTGSGTKCLHINGNPDQGWVGDSFAHVLTVALLGEYDHQIGGEGAWGAR